jgi:hypothetical protein
MDNLKNLTGDKSFMDKIKDLFVQHGNEPGLKDQIRDLIGEKQLNPKTPSGTYGEGILPSDAAMTETRANAALDEANPFKLMSRQMTPEFHDMSEVVKKMSPEELQQLMHTYSTSKDYRTSPSDLWDMAQELLGKTKGTLGNATEGMGSGVRTPFMPIALTDIWPSEASKQRIKDVPYNQAPNDVLKSLAGIPDTTIETLKQKYPEGI